MDDLVERIRTAIDADERIALGATDNDFNLEWWVSHALHAGQHTVRTVGGNRPVLRASEHDSCAEEDGEYKPTATFDPALTSEHAARHDPKRTLAMVQAHREILEMHPHRRFQEPLDAKSRFDEDHQPAFAEDPRYVGCERCHWDNRHEEVHPSYWCDTVLALAKGYGIEVGA